MLIIILAGMLALLGGCAAPQYIGVLGGIGNPVNTGQRDRIEADSADKPTASIVYGVTRPWLRTEAELGWRWSALHGYNHGQLEESATGNVHVIALTGNAWLEPPFGWRRIRPYGGGGVGPALQIREGRSSLTRTDLDQISAEFAWQAGGGVRIVTSERLSADLGARYFDAGDIEEQLFLAGLVFALAP